MLQGREISKSRSTSHKREECLEEVFGVVPNPNTKTTIKFNGLTFHIKSTPDVYYASGVQSKALDYVLVMKGEKYFRRLKGNK
jgi:hypothetical protein